MPKTVNDILNQTISHGTLRPYDLIPAFFDLYAELRPQGQYLPFKECHLVELPESHPFWQSESGWITLEAVVSALDGLAPEGHYFGAHPGDGSDFGFWRCDDADNTPPDFTDDADTAEYGTPTEDDYREPPQ